MPNLYFLLAALVVGLTVAIHCLAGGRRIVRPMLASQDLHPSVKAVLYGCWHAFTILHLGLGLGFLFAAWRPEAQAFAFMGTGLAALLAGFSAWVILRFGQSFRRLPHWALFLATAVLGGLGLVM